MMLEVADAMMAIRVYRWEIVVRKGLFFAHMSAMIVVPSSKHAS